jgi:hypothetical protein
MNPDVIGVSVAPIQNCYAIFGCGVGQVLFMRFITMSDGSTWKYPIFEHDFGECIGDYCGCDSGEGGYGFGYDGSCLVFFASELTEYLFEGLTKRVFRYGQTDQKTLKDFQKMVRRELNERGISIIKNHKTNN